MPHSSTLKIHHSSHLPHHHISFFLLWPSYLSLIKILTFVSARSDNSSILRSLIDTLPNPFVKYGNIHTNSGDWDVGMLGKLLFCPLQSSFWLPKHYVYPTYSMHPMRSQTTTSSTYSSRFHFISLTWKSKIQLGNSHHDPKPGKSPMRFLVPPSRTRALPSGALLLSSAPGAPPSEAFWFLLEGSKHLQ